MGTPDTPIALSTAECTARTGLSARALRLYEEHGLITPGRSAGGWRLYGPEDLVRLNAITLLKLAGLTLAQIASIIDTGSHGPDLKQLLRIQSDNWRTRRVEAERGQRIVDVALERLSAGESLTVDDLCNVIRSLEMGQSNDAHGTDPETQDAVQISDAILDSYAGQYQIGDWRILTVKRDGAKLFIEYPNRPQVELRPTSECDFEALDVVEQPVTFDRGTDGTVSSLRLRTKGGDMMALRVDSATADLVRARLAARIRDQKALAGSEAAVRRLVEGLISGQPNYVEMLPVFAHIAKQQLHQLHTAAAFLGAIQSIDFKGVGGQGWDVYDVRHERGTSRVRIIQRSDGLIAGAIFMVKDGPVSLGP